MKLHNNAFLGAVYLLLLSSSGTPTLTVEGGSMLETDSGNTTAHFALSLSHKHDKEITFDYATAADTAEIGTDFAPIAGVFSMPENTENALLMVDITGDQNEEPDEDFRLVISNIVNAETNNNEATFWIRNDDNVSYGLTERPDNTECLAGDRPTFDASISLTNAFGNTSFTSPLGMFQPPQDSSRYFIIEKAGIIKIVEDGTLLEEPFLNISNQVSDNGERGLLGFAFHPNFPTINDVYLSYTDNSGDTVISKFTVSNSDPNIANINSEVTILSADQPYSNHNGGHIEFGPDGFLYIGLGDGGSGGDPQNYAQDTSTFLGSMLRINIDNVSPYSIPADNPFNGQSCNQTSRTGNCPEIYAWGLRNPWRWSFDTFTGGLWAGDVGQGEHEEVSIINNGDNLGWRCFEGNEEYNSDNCETTVTVAPVATYPHAGGACSITGGYVYRGTEIPELRGTYIYGDYCNGEIYGLPYYSQPNSQPYFLADSFTNISSFAQDNAGELYLISINGVVSKITAVNNTSSSSVPQVLSDSPCVSSTNPSIPIPSMIPYDVNAAHWSDGAQSSRWLSLPNATFIDHNSGQDWNLPVGSVLMKTFELDGNLIETRFMMRHNDGGWGGYTYEWNDLETEAALVTGGNAKDINGQTWVYPSGAECATCHTDAAGNSLSLETAQLNKDKTYSLTGITANQLESLEHIALFNEIFPRSPYALDHLANPSSTSTPIEDRARAWLHTNCANCHQPGGPTNVTIDFRYKSDLEDMDICNISPQNGDWGLLNPKLLIPGNAALSLIYQRANRRGLGQMPPIISQEIDTAGIALLANWINSLSSCP